MLSLCVHGNTYSEVAPSVCQKREVWWEIGAGKKGAHAIIAENSIKIDLKRREEARGEIVQRVGEVSREPGRRVIECGRGRHLIVAGQCRRIIKSHSTRGRALAESPFPNNVPCIDI